jgi:ABC-type sugar transport system ATPase subunit
MSLAEQGIAVLVISSDLPEVLAIADRILVMYEGHILGSLSRDEATEEAILRIALGLNTAQPQYQTPS